MMLLVCWLAVLLLDSGEIRGVAGGDSEVVMSNNFAPLLHDYFPPSPTLSPSLSLLLLDRRYR